MNKNEIIFGGLSLAVIVSCTFAVVEALKLRNVSDKLDIAASHLSGKVNIDEDIVSSVIDKVVKEEAKVQVSKHMDKAAQLIASTYNRKIQNAVEEEMKLQRNDLEKQLKKRISNIDISELKRRVMTEAKEECMNKLKDDLDSLSDKYTEQVESMASIYETIASKLEAIGD